MLKKALLPVSLALLLLALVVGVTVGAANAGSVNPNHPTPVPAKPHSIGVIGNTWSWPVPHAYHGGVTGERLTMEAEGIGWPGTK